MYRDAMVDKQANRHVSANLHCNTISGEKKKKPHHEIHNAFAIGYFNVR
jgi:hypothetical protein